MTLQEIINSDNMFLRASDISEVMGSDPQTIRVTARQAPQLLGFPFTFTGNRMKIPRIPFLRFCGVQENEIRKEK